MVKASNGVHKNLNFIFNINHNNAFFSFILNIQDTLTSYNGPDCNKPLQPDSLILYAKSKRGGRGGRSFYMINQVRTEETMDI